MHRPSGVNKVIMELWPPRWVYVAMPDFPIDPELSIRGSPPVVLRRTTEAVAFIRNISSNRPNARLLQDLLHNLEAAADEWNAMEAVVQLELLLEAEGLLIDDKPVLASTSPEERSRAA
jgi:hypothetical protein